MFAVVRRYQGASQLLEELARRQADVAGVLRGVPGFGDDSLVRSADGGASITVCQDQAGAQPSTRQAAAWVRENVPAAAGNPPEVTEGEVLFHIQP